MRILDAVASGQGKVTAEVETTPLPPAPARAGICRRCGHGCCNCFDCAARRKGQLNLCFNCFRKEAA